MNDHIEVLRGLVSAAVRKVTGCADLRAGELSLVSEICAALAASHQPEVTCAVCEELVERIGNGYVPNGSREEQVALREAALQRLATPKPDTVADETGVEFFAVPEGLHPNTANLVARFATALAEKLAAAERKYGYSDNWARPDWMDECRRKLVEHIAKGDPRDVAAYCAFLWHHGESTTPQQPAAHPAITHCDNCGCDWLDNGLNPIGCPYCKQPAPVVPKGGYAGCTLWRGSLRVTVVETESLERRVDPDQAFRDMAQRALDSLAGHVQAFRQALTVAARQQQGGRDDG